MITVKIDHKILREAFLNVIENLQEEDRVMPYIGKEEAASAADYLFEFLLDFTVENKK